MDPWVSSHSWIDLNFHVFQYLRLVQTILYFGFTQTLPLTLSSFSLLPPLLITAIPSVQTRRRRSLLARRGTTCSSMLPCRCAAALSSVLACSYAAPTCVAPLCHSHRYAAPIAALPHHRLPPLLPPRRSSPAPRAACAPHPCQGPAVALDEHFTILRWTFVNKGINILSLWWQFLRQNVDLVYLNCLIKIEKCWI